MTLSLSLSLPGRKTGELSDPLFKTVRYFALRGSPSRPGAQDGTIPFFNIFDNPGGNKGEVYARVNVNDNGTYELWQDDVNLGDKSVSLGSGNTLAGNIEFGARVQLVQGQFLLATETASEQTVFLTDNDQHGAINYTLDQLHNFNLLAFIPSSTLFTFQDGRLWDDSQRPNPYGLVARSEYVKTNALHSLLTSLPNNHRTQMIVGQQEYCRTENDPPTGWATTVPDDTNNNGIVSINARLARNYSGGLILGPPSQASNESVYYHIGGSDIIDFDPSGNTGAYGNEYGDEYD